MKYLLMACLSCVMCSCGWVNERFDDTMESFAVVGTWFDVEPTPDSK